MTAYTNVTCPKCGHTNEELDFTIHPGDLWPACFIPCDNECGHIFTESEVTQYRKDRNMPSIDKTAKFLQELAPGDDYQNAIAAGAKALVQAGLPDARYHTQWSSYTTLWKDGEDTYIVPKDGDQVIDQAHRQIWPKV